MSGRTQHRVYASEYGIALMRAIHGDAHLRQTVADLARQQLSEPKGDVGAHALLLPLEYTA